MELQCCRIVINPSVHVSALLQSLHFLIHHSCVLCYTFNAMAISCLACVIVCVVSVLLAPSSFSSVSLGSLMGMCHKAYCISEKCAFLCMW